jgi:hypothetical protein
MAQTVFERIEKKYLLTAEQYAALAPRLAARMQPDAYGRYTIGNIYYDTPDYALIRASLAGPVYKEKLRLRCYGTPCADSTVFLELKKKYRGVVYKRRASMPLAAAEEYLAGGAAPALPRPEPAAPSGAQPPAADPAQILREMDYFLSFYHPEAKVCLSYDRTAFFCPEEPELRVTFDENIRWRTWDMTLAAGAAGRTLAMGAPVLMEIKIPGAMPLWLSRLLGENGVFPSSFSKYGCCYASVLSQPSLIVWGGVHCA